MDEAISYTSGSGEPVQIEFEHKEQTEREEQRTEWEEQRKALRGGVPFVVDIVAGNSLPSRASFLLFRQNRCDRCL